MIHNAENIARALNGKRSGRGWLCHCPAHEDRSPSLSIADGKNGKLLVKCFAGCDARDVLVALRKITPDYWPQPYRPVKKVPDNDTHKEWSSEADNIWLSTAALAGSLAETYLLARGCRIPDCDDLRFLSHYKGWPAMAARVTCAITNKPFTLHFTLLDRDGSRKAPIEKQKLLLFGHRSKGGLIRLSRDEDVTMGLAIAEGIETALCCNWSPIWATGNAGNIASFSVLPEINCLTVFADHDKVGLASARQCAERWQAAGREARIVPPNAAGDDWADVAKGAAL